MSTNTGRAPSMSAALAEATKEKDERDHLVSGLDAEGLEGEDEGVGAGVHADAVGHPAQRGQLRLEGRHLGAQDEPAGGEHPGRRRLEVRAEGGVLALQVDLRDQKPSPRADVAAWPTPRRLTEIRNSLSWPKR